MKRMFPFVFIVVGLLMSIAVLTAVRGGVLEKLGEIDWRERLASHDPETKDVVVPEQE